MALIEDAIVAKLAAVLSHSRIYPDGDIPQNMSTRPAVTYQQMSDQEPGYLTGRSTIRIDTFELEIHADTRRQISQEKDRIRAAFAGENASGWWLPTIHVLGAVAGEVQASGDDSYDASEELVRYARLSLKIHWRIAS